MEFCHVKLSHDFYPSLCIFQSSCWKWSSTEIVWKALCKLHWSFPGPASQLPPILMPCSFSTGIAWRKAMTARDSTYTKKKKTRSKLLMNAKLLYKLCRSAQCALHLMINNVFFFCICVTSHNCSVLKDITQYIIIKMASLLKLSVLENYSYKNWCPGSCCLFEFGNLTLMTHSALSLQCLKLLSCEL